MTRYARKSWQDKRPGWTRRVTWYEGDYDMRLRFEDALGIQNRVYKTVQEAQRDYDRFRDGLSIREIDRLNLWGDPTPEQQGGVA